MSAGCGWTSTDEDDGLMTEWAEEGSSVNPSEQAVFWLLVKASRFHCFTSQTEKAPDVSCKGYCVSRSNCPSSVSSLFLVFYYQNKAPYRKCPVLFSSRLSSLCLLCCQHSSATCPRPSMDPAWTPQDKGHENIRRDWQIENWFFTSEGRTLYPNLLAGYTNIPMLSSLVLFSATMRIGLTPLHPMSQTHGTDGQREGK